MDVFEHKRKIMVDSQIKTRGYFPDKVLGAMLRVERHLFVPADKVAYAYEDRPLSIGYGQTISQPYIVALMTESAQLTGREKVLEIGTGSGYQCAVLSLLAAEVFTLERIKQLAGRAEKVLEENRYHNCRVYIRDGYSGLPEEAPFDVIIVTAAPHEIPPLLQKQLNPLGGRMIIPVGSGCQKLVKIVRSGNRFSSSDITDVIFVPMLPGTDE